MYVTPMERRRRSKLHSSLPENFIFTINILFFLIINYHIIFMNFPLFNFPLIRLPQLIKRDIWLLFLDSFPSLVSLNNGDEGRRPAANGAKIRVPFPLNELNGTSKERWSGCWDEKAGEFPMTNKQTALIIHIQMNTSIFHWIFIFEKRIRGKLFVNKITLIE